MNLSRVTVPQPSPVPPKATEVKLRSRDLGVHYWHPNWEALGVTWMHTWQVDQMRNGNLRPTKVPGHNSYVIGTPLLPGHAQWTWSRNVETLADDVIPGSMHGDLVKEKQTEWMQKRAEWMAYVISVQNSIRAQQITDPDEEDLFQRNMGTYTAEDGKHEVKIIITREEMEEWDRKKEGERRQPQLQAHAQ